MGRYERARARPAASSGVLVCLVMSNTPEQIEGGPPVELTFYADVTTVQLVHEADLWMVAYTHGGSPGAIDHIDTGTLVCEVGSGANDRDVVAYIENRLRAAG